MIYLDNAATTFPKPDEVYDYVDWVQRNIAVNVGRASYKVSQEAMDIVEETKKHMARMFHAFGSESVFFTPSATIAANEVIGGLVWDSLKNVYVSPFEHNAIMRPLEKMRLNYGFNIYELPFDGERQELDEEEMSRLFSLHKPDYVFINQVSNVTGVIIPVDIIGKEAKKYDAIVIVDGSQSLGLLQVDLTSEQIDYLIFAGHKNLFASWGIGGFIRNTKHELTCYINGGTGSDSLNLSVQSFETGSPNIIAIASLYKSLEWIESTGILNIAEYKSNLIRKLIDGLTKTGAKMYIPCDLTRHTSVVSFNIPGYTPSEIGMILDQDFDIAVRTGYHCAPYVHRLIGTEETQGTVRASVSYFTAESDIDVLLESIKDL